mmetsp:Transcript_655/g.1294  ORF Transcript_655/g.1294 Transcript_655/m.1294 type:complete len:80 (+) Transcript_655:724-963(+)
MSATSTSTTHKWPQTLMPIPGMHFFFMLALGSNSAVPGMHAYTSWVLVGVCHHEVQETRGKTVFGLGPFAKGGLCDMVT